MDKPITFLFALREEQKAVTRLLKHRFRFHVIGMGPSAAYKETKRILASERQPFYVLLGICGACRSGLKPGMAVAPNRVFTALSDQSIYLPTSEIISDLPHDPLVTIDSAATTEIQKRILFERTQAWGCDMESAAVAKAFEEAKRLDDFLIIRAVMDPVGQDIKFVTRAFTRKARFYEYLFPPNFWQLIQSARHFRSACRALAHAANSLFGQI